MSREVAHVVTFTCNGCDERETVGIAGPDADAIVEKKGWRTEELIFGATVDLCPSCVRHIKVLTKWVDPAISIPGAFHDYSDGPPLEADGSEYGEGEILDGHMP